MSILITGGTGFLGRHLARYMLEKTDESIVLFDHLPNREAVADLSGRLEIVEGDCAEATELLRAIKSHGVKDIFHLASYVGETAKLPAQAIRANVIGTHNVFELALATGVRRVVWASTASVHRSVWTSANPVVVDETVPPQPEGIYGASKLFNEHIAEDYHVRYGLDHVALRPTSVFGRGRSQRRGGGGGLYANLIETVASGKTYGPAPPPEHKVMWAYVLDCVDAFYRVWKTERLEHRIFTFGGELSTIGETVEFLRTLLPDVNVTFGSEPIKIVPPASDRLLREETGYKPLYGMKDGIRHYVNSLIG